MSQTEVIMVLVLGVVLCLIFVLFFARTIWNMGQRLSRRRAEKAKPAQIRTLEADRDQLRAGHAIMTQRLQSGLAEAKAKVVAQQAEVARHRNRVLSMTETINTQSSEIDRLDENIRQLTEQSNAQQAAIEQRDEIVADLRGEVAARDEDIQTLKSELQSTIDLVNDSQRQLALLEAERADAEKRNQIARAQHDRDVALQEALEKDLASTQRMMAEQQLRSAQEPPVFAVKPAGTTTAQPRFVAEIPEDGLSLPTVPPRRPLPPNDFAKLMQNARQTMMNRQANQAKEEPESKSSRAIANVVSLAQKIRNERSE
jgi:Na+-transporting methylmalonyl-CoA/oxaloacetate decarboxylase gamma subunit